MWLLIAVAVSVKAECDAGPTSGHSLLQSRSLPKNETLYLAYMNMREDDARRRHMENELRKHGLDAVRIEPKKLEKLPDARPLAYLLVENGKPLPSQALTCGPVPAERPESWLDCILDKSTLTKYMFNATWRHCNQDGCEEVDNTNASQVLRYISHKFAVMQFLDNFARSGEELGILLEDDAVLRSGFKSLLRKVVQHAPEDWELIKLGWWGMCRKKLVRKFFIKIRKDRCLGTHGLLVRRSSVPKILVHLARLGLGFSADVEISLLSDAGDVKAYAVTEERKLVDLKKKLDTTFD